MVLFRKPDKKVRPLCITIAGEPGVGKTTLGATFLRPGFIKFEEGTQSIRDYDFVETPKLETSEQGFDAVREAGRNPDIATLVIDSISTLENIVEREVVRGSNKATNINQAGGGYGGGQKVMASRMGEFKALCDSTGKNVIFLCHTDIREAKTVDMEPYNILTLRLHKHTSQHFVDLVDCVAFLRLKLYDQRKGDEKVVLSSDERELICHPMATITAKNRLEITEALPCPIGTNPIVDFVKAKLKAEKES